VWKVEGFFFVYLGETVFEYHFLKLSPKPAPTAWISGKKKKKPNQKKKKKKKKKKKNPPASRSNE